MATLVVEIKAFRRTRVLALRDTLASYQAQSPLWTRLAAFAETHEIPIVGKCLAVYFDPGYKASDVDVETCVPIDEDFVVPETDAEIHATHLPPLPRAASVVYKGPYDGLAEIYRQIFSWVDAHGERADGLVREIYHVTLASTDDKTKLETEVVVPLA